LGATINDDTINRIKAKVIAGAANNQLANEQVHGQILKDRGILYAPDFLINAGGIINVYAEIVGYDKAEAMRRTENIYNTTLEIFSFAEAKGLTTYQAALSVAENRIAERKKENAK
jgi:leucine dehydrogenase